MAEATETPTQSEPTPPQSEPKMRDMDARQRTFGAYREIVQRNSGNAQATALDTAEDTFLRQNYDASVPHEGEAVFDEHGRVEELNGVYLDQMVEKYIGRVSEVDRAKNERKDGTGLIGRIRGGIRRHIDENPVGKRIKYVLKGAAGAAAMATSAGAGVFAPALAYAGKRLALDAAGEALQYELGERPILQIIEQLGRDRDQRVLELTNIRNQITNKNDDYELSDISRPLASGRSLQDDLTRFVVELDQIEQSILREEANLARVRTWGKRIRAMAGLAFVSLPTLAHLFKDGLSMGIQDFDKLAHIAGKSGVEHQVKLMADGVHFVVNAGEHYGPLNIISHSGGELGRLGSMAPWGQIWGSISALGVGMIGSTAAEIGEARHQGGIWQRSANPTKEDQAVFSLRGRDTLGAASGVQHEMAEQRSGGSNRRTIEARRADLEQRKTRFEPKTIWKIPTPSAAVAAASTPDRIIQVDHWEGKDLFYREIDPTRKMASNDGMVVETNLLIERNASHLIESGTKEADDYDQYIGQGSEATRLAKLLEVRGALSVDQDLRVSTAFILHLDGTVTQNLSPNDLIKINHLSPDQTRATIIITDASGAVRGTFSGAHTIELATNAVNVDIPKEQGLNSENSLKNINNTLRTWGPFNEIGNSQLFRLNDGTNPNQWLFITNVDKEKGTISYFIGDDFATINGIANAAAKKTALTNAMDAVNPVEQNFTEFFNFVDERDGAGNRVNRITFSTNIK